MTYRGDYRVGTTFNHHFTTVNASGVPTTLGNTPSLEYYVDGGTTGFTSGLTLSTDINSRTGLNNVQVVATTSATGLASGKNVSISIAAGTVSGVSVIGYNILEYSLANRSALMPTTGGVTLSVASTGGAAIDWANVGNPGSTVSLSATTLFTTTNLTNGVNANISSSSINLGAIITACNTIVPANVTAASINIGAVVTAINTIANANVTSISTVVPANITASSINIGAIVTAANTNIGAVVTAVNTITPARVTAQGIDIGAIVTAANTNVGAVVTAMNTIANANVTSFSASGIGTLYTISPNITYASATTTSLLRALVTGVWDEPGANHTTAGSLGQELNSAGAGGDPWQTAIPGAYVAGQAGFIVGNRVDVSVGSRLATGATVASVSVLGTVAGVSAIGTVAGVSVIQTVTANILAVAGVAVSGFGTVGSPWGP